VLEVDDAVGVDRVPEGNGTPKNRWRVMFQSP
jgi:hypothetical protein